MERTGLRNTTCSVLSLASSSSVDTVGPRERTASRNTTCCMNVADWLKCRSPSHALREMTRLQLQECAALCRPAVQKRHISLLQLRRGWADHQTAALAVLLLLPPHACHPHCAEGTCGMTHMTQLPSEAHEPCPSAPRIHRQRSHAYVRSTETNGELW